MGGYIETWKEIEGFNGYYEVSNMGRVRSVDRYVNSRWGDNTRFEAGKVLEPLIKKGYVCYNLADNGKVTTMKGHTLVAAAFIPNPENKKTINHINGIKTDNRVDNLEWNTHKENIGHYINVLGRKPNYNSILVLDTQTGIFYETVKSAAISKGINVGRVKALIEQNNNPIGLVKA